MTNEHHVDQLPLLASNASAQCAVRPDRGFVLLIVLWWLAVLMVMATQMTAASRTTVQITTNILSSAIAEAQADGAVNEAVFQILAQHWTANGITHLVHGPLAVAEVRVEDEGSRIDPNVAPAVLMQALLQECGAAPKTAMQLSISISEWRSVDRLRADDATQVAQYRAASLGYLPPNKRFVSIDELGLVLGMTPGLLTCLQPHVSVYSLSVPTLQTTVDPLVRQALAQVYPYETAQPVATAEHEVAVVRITAVSQQNSGGRFRRLAVVRVQSTEPDDHFIYKVLAWSGSAD